jgi:hypothetical protein
MPRILGWPLALTAVGLAAAGLLWGAAGFGLVLILAVLEISLSFDNAVVNASVLKRMAPLWQRIFLTVGLLIAVFGMRLLLPLLVVGLTARLSPTGVLELAMNGGRTHNGHSYREFLAMADPAIAGFGGIFLLMIFLDFAFQEKELHWLRWIERPLERLGRLDALPTVLALAALLFTARYLAAGHGRTVLVAGLLGLATHLVVNGLSGVVESGVREGRSTAVATGKAAFLLFLHLEVLDASFSFDGVVGAFAVSQNIFQITLGLGMGALYIRALTVHLVRKGTLDDYVYLEHGAHYAIGALALILLAGIEHRIPQIVTGLVGVAFIGAALVSSMARNRRLQAAH